MEAVKKAASGAVDSIRNSPLFRRKFGTSYQKAEEEEEQQQQRPLAPERDLTPFVQGIYFQVRWPSSQARDDPHSAPCRSSTLGRIT